MVHFDKLKIFLKNYLFMAVPGLRCNAGFSLVARIGGCSLVAMCGLLVAVASFVAEHEQGTGASVVVAPGLQSTNSTVVAHRLCCSVVCGVFPDQGSNLCLLHWQADSLPLSHQGSLTKYKS